MGMSTFTICLFFLFSRNTGNYYYPMLMLPASLVVTCPALRSQGTVWLLLLISGLCVAGDVIWMALGQPLVLIDTFSSVSSVERLLAGFLTASVLVRMACLAMLAQLGLHIATSKRFS